eukprot:Em0024g418a
MKFSTNVAIATTSYVGQSDLIGGVRHQGTSLNLQLVFSLNFTGSCTLIGLSWAGLCHGPCSDTNDGRSPLYMASQEGHLDVVKTLIEAGANIHQAEKDGQSPLFISCLNGHLDIVKTLIEAGANINQATKKGGSSLGAASYKGHLNIVKTLMEAGANINHADENGESPLFITSQNGHLDVVKTLIEAGANIYQSAWQCLPKM